MKLSQERKMFEQCAREVLCLIDDDVRILPQSIIKFILKKHLEIAQHRRERQIPLRHQLFRQGTLIVDRDLSVPVTGAQPLEKKLIEAKVEHLKHRSYTTSFDTTYEIPKIATRSLEKANVNIS